MAESPILQVNNFSKHFELHEQQTQIPSSHDVNLSVFSGQLTALVGPTGSGKSSVLKGIYRTYLPSSGQLLYRTRDNQQVDLAQLDEHRILNLRRDEISFVTQFLHSLPRQNTLDVVATPLYNRGIERTIAHEKAKDILTKLRLPERLWSISPATFSGGEKQRVNLARGLLAQPRLLLLDEPTASLDTTTTEYVIELINHSKQQGVGILAIFHQPELVERLAEHCVELSPPRPLLQEQTT